MKFYSIIIFVILLGGCASPKRTAEIERFEGTVEKRSLGGSVVLVVESNGVALGRLSSKTLNLTDWIGKKTTIMARRSFLPVSKNGEAIPLPAPAKGEAENRRIRQEIEDLPEWLKCELRVISIQKA